MTIQVRAITDFEVPILRKRLKNKTHWVTFSGIAIKFADIEDEHLLNIVLLLLLNYKKLSEARFFHHRWLLKQPAYKALFKEAYERGILETLVQ